MDIKRIPILSLSSTISVTDLLSELPLPSPHLDSLNQSLWHSQEVFKEACRILNSNNKSVFDSLSKALSNTTTDEILLKEQFIAEKANANDVPSIFKMMVFRDTEKFRNKIGFEDLFVKEEPKPAASLLENDSITSKGKNEKSMKIKKKKREDSSAPKEVKEVPVNSHVEAYTISQKLNGLRFSFKKVNVNSTSDQKSSSIKNENTTLEFPSTDPSAMKSVDSLGVVSTKTNIDAVNGKKFTISSFSCNSTDSLNCASLKSFDESSKSTDDYIQVTSKNSDIKPFSLSNNQQQSTIDEPYFSVGLSHHGADVFSNKSMLFDTTVSNLDSKDHQSDAFLDPSNLKSNNPHSNSLSKSEMQELQMSDSTVKDGILGIDLNRSDSTSNSPLHDDSHSYQQSSQQQFGLAAYLSKTNITNNNNNNNNSNNNNNGSALSNDNQQPGSCLSAGQNSVDNSEVKTSDASIPDSASVQPNGPNSALSENDLMERKLEKRGRGRNKELENLKRWQIKDKGIPTKNDPLDCTTVGPGERVKKRTRRCVKRNEREDCSSLSENSYHMTDVSPVAVINTLEIAQTSKSIKSDSSVDDDMKLSPQINNMPSPGLRCNTPPSSPESSSETSFNLPLKENAQSQSIDVSADVNFNSTDIASSLASIVQDDDLPEVTYSLNNNNDNSSSNIQGKKLPTATQNQLSRSMSFDDGYQYVNVNQTPLPVEITGEMSDETSNSSSDFSTKYRMKSNAKVSKRNRKSKTTNINKPSGNIESRIQHLFANKENKVAQRERIFRATQYNRNMNPIVLISPISDHLCDFNNLDSPSSNSTLSTIPFTFDPDGTLFPGDIEIFHSKSKHCEKIKSKFFSFLDSLLKDVEELDLLNIASSKKAGNEIDTFDCNEHDARLSGHSLNLLNSYVAKMKSYNIMNDVPSGKLVRLLTLLLVNMNSAVKVPTESKKKVQKNLQEQLYSCLDASLIALSIMISPDMPRAIFLEDVIEDACDLFRTVLRHIIYPVYDNNFKCQTNPNDILLTVISNISITKKESDFMLGIYSRIQCGINCLAELMHQKPNRLTDEAVIKLTSLGLTCLTVNNVHDIQQSMIPLMAAVFSQYEGHRKSIVSDILSSLTHSQTKKVVKKYRVNSLEEIQMVSALALTLFQSVVQKPKTNKKGGSTKTPNDLSNEQGVVYNFCSAQRIMQIFVQTFFKKVCFKGEDCYKIAFERFIQDLFIMFHKPEWPAANFLLYCIGSTLVHHLNTSQTNRTIAIDFLGLISSFICRHISVDDLKSKPTDSVVISLLNSLSKSCKVKPSASDIIQAMCVEEKIQLLKYLVLNFLTLDSSDSTCMFARFYSVGNWLHDLLSSNEAKSQHSKKDKLPEPIRLLTKSEEEFKNNLLTQMMPNCTQLDTCEIMELSYESACNILRILSVHKDMQSFEMYLSKICKSLDENSVPARTKAMRSLSLILEEDPSLLMRSEIEKSVNARFLDSSIAVRETTVDLVGKFLLRKPDLIQHYYPVLINRIIDTGTSVRKRVIKVLWDICTSQNDFPHTSEVYAKIMKRMYDEDSIKKLVNEVFKSIWFSPISDKDNVKLQKRIFSIADVIHGLSNDQKCNHNWVLQFIVQLIKEESEQNSDVKSQKHFEKSLQQIMESLVQTVLRLQDVSGNSSDTNPSTQNTKSILYNPQKFLLSSWSALHIFAKVRPRLVWPYLGDLSSLLRQIRSSDSNNSLKHTLVFNNDMAICMNHLCGTLDAGLGAVHGYNLEHSSITLTKEDLNEISNDLINLAANAPNRFMVDSAIKCLSRISSFTQEYSIVQNCFHNHFKQAVRYSDQLKSSLKVSKGNDSKVSLPLSRLLYTMVVLYRFFNPNEYLYQEMVHQTETVSTKLLDLTMLFADSTPKNSELRCKAIFNMNHLVHKKHILLLNGPINKFYINTLNLINDEPIVSNESSRMIKSVLDNISDFLKHNELKMTEENANWKTKSHTESLKETNDVSGSFGNQVAQTYQKLVLDCCMVSKTEVRLAAIKLVCKILTQGLVQPSTAVSYLIALQGDFDNNIKFKADSQLNELNSKYPTYLTMRAISGIRLSYKLQKAISVTACQSDEIQGKKVIRGWTFLNANFGQSGIQEQSLNLFNIQAINHQLYSSLRKVKQHWRTFLDGMVNLFDEAQQCDLAEQIFAADQLSAFPYQILEEPVFLVYRLDLLISVIGPTVLRCCKDVFKQLSKPIADRAYKDGELTSNELTILVKLLSESSFDNRQLVYLSIRSCKSIFLMLSLKDYIKKVYGIHDVKINSYNPENNCKQWEKQVFRNLNVDIFEIPTQCLTNMPDLDKLKSNEVNFDCVKQLLLDFLEFRNKLLAIDSKAKGNDGSNQCDVLPVIERVPDVEVQSKIDAYGRGRVLSESRLDKSSEQSGKQKPKIIRPETQSDSDVSSSSSSFKRTPKKQKVSYSNNIRTPIAGKEIPNLTSKDGIENKEKECVTSNIDGRKTANSVSCNSNNNNLKSSKVKPADKFAPRLSLTSLPSDFLGSSVNKPKPSNFNKSFKSNVSGESGKLFHGNNKSVKIVDNLSETTNIVYSNKSRISDNNHKRLGNPVNVKPRKRQRLMSSSSDSEQHSN